MEVKFLSENSFYSIFFIFIIFVTIKFEKLWKDSEVNTTTIKITITTPKNDVAGINSEQLIFLLIFLLNRQK